MRVRASWAVAMLAVSLAVTPCFAQAARTFVSSNGSDGNDCSRQAPCRSFATAITKTASGGEINTNNVQAIQTLPEPIRTEVLTAYTHAITDIYLLSIPIIVVALVVVLFLKEIPLRTRAAEVANASTSDDPNAEIDAAMPSFSH